MPSIVLGIIKHAHTVAAVNLFCQKGYRMDIKQLDILLKFADT